MKKIVYLSFIFLLLFLSCEKRTPEKISKQDIDYVKSLKRISPNLTLNTIDSILIVDDISKPQKALLYFTKGKNLSILQKDQQAIEYFEKSLSLFIELKSNKYIAETHWHLGAAYAFINNKTEATNHLLKAIELNEALKDDKLEANIYGSLAHVHYLYKDYQEAVNYTIKAINIHKKNKDTLGFSATYNNLAVIYKNIADYQNALKYNKLSLKYNLLLNDQSAIAKSYNNLGLVYDEMVDSKMALEYFKKAIKINKQIQNNNTTALQNIADLYRKTKEYDNAIRYYHKVLDILNNNNRANIKKEIYNNLLLISLQTNDINNSLLYQKKRDSFSIIQNNNENTEKLKSLENQYQLVRQENELTQEKQTNQNIKLIFAIISILLLSFVFISFQYFRTKKLKDEKEKIQLEQQVLRSQMNPHFIFNALSAIQNSLLDNEPIKSASYLSRFAKLIRQNFDFISKKTVLLKEEIDSLQNYMDTQKLRFNDKFDYEINIFANVNIEIDEIPPMLLQPFVENSIEHGFKNKKEMGQLIINISKNTDSICYEIKDNGKGISTNDKNNKTHSMDIVKKRLKLLGANDERSFKISTSNKGTTVKFCITQ